MRNLPKDFKSGPVDHSLAPAKSAFLKRAQGSHIGFPSTAPFLSQLLAYGTCQREAGTTSMLQHSSDPRYYRGLFSMGAATICQCV